MRTCRSKTGIWTLLLTVGWSGLRAEVPPYRQASLPVEERVEDLLARMTLQEKILQLNQYTLGRNDNPNDRNAVNTQLPPEIGSLIYMGSGPEMRNRMQRRAMEETRLGIPILFAYNTVHGFRTIFPIPLAQACSWNPRLVEAACVEAARETRLTGIEWTFAPMVDVARDGRWGRIAEGFGEDVHANAVFCAAAVRGFQGTTLADTLRIAACLKHYVGYGASLGGRDYVPTEISRQTLWDTYLPPFEAGVRAGAATLMSSFNDISGTPATANGYTLTEILKKRWKHDGFVVSDWDAILQLVHQGRAAGRREAARLAFLAGVEMDMTDNCYRDHLGELIAAGEVEPGRLDDAVRRVLRLKFRLGLFERPYVPERPEKERFLRPEALTLADSLAAESCVLLKNETRILPLAPGCRIAVIGPLADAREHLLGSWCGRGEARDVTTLYDGLCAEFGAEQVRYARGCDFNGDDRSGFPEAVAAAREAQVVVLCLGERRQWTGENASRATLALPPIQEELARTLSEVGKPIVLLLSNGRPLELCRLEPLCAGILEIWQPGTAGGKPVAGLLSGRLNPSGRLAVTFPRTTGQIPIYYNQRRKARPDQGAYLDLPDTPMYPFGHGLSYAEFRYGEIRQVSVEPLVLELTVTNTSSRDGAESLLWYVSDPVCSITRPVRELKHFEKRLIRAGDSETFRFEVDPLRDLGFVDETGRRFLEPGEYWIQAGPQKFRLLIPEE